ncbi:MAG: hypothetical protein HN719_05500 [Alphaproteobacteria bacterium]|nr:hypothetical protein [Alphaproteobacteria bacterium]
MSVGLDFEAIHGVLSKVQWADSKNVIIGGHSTGGVGALYYAGLKPNGVIGVLNIAGTYGCTGGTYGGRNIWKTRTGWKEHVTNGNSVRQLWLYGDNDSYTAISDLKDYVGMKNIELVILNGADHHILDGKLSDLPERWKPTVSKFLNSIKGELQ